MTEKIIKSFSDFVDYTDKYKNIYLFRGQANIVWNIEPSLFRKDSYLNAEAEIIKEEVSLESDNLISKVFKLQHYGKPTRLVDLTISPLSALFFAVEDEEQEKYDGVVYVIRNNDGTSHLRSKLELFSEALIKKDLNIEKLNVDITEEVLIDILTGNYILQYDYDFSYTNRRAILQGGTALLFGFGYRNGKFYRKGTKDISNLIKEKIIIPKELKPCIKDNLKRLGFCKEILYDALENIAIDKMRLELKRDEFKLSKNSEFNKIITMYRINLLLFSQDYLVKMVTNIYERLFAVYGEKSRIYLYIFYDDNDRDKGNYICISKWDKDLKYKIEWKKDYYLNRMRYINEEVSTNEIIYKYANLINETNKILSSIKEIINIDDYEMNILIDEMNKHESNIKTCLSKTNDIGYGKIGLGDFQQYATNYICDVHELILGILNYYNRGEDYQFLRYWSKKLLENCYSSKEVLYKESQNLSILLE